MKHIIRKPYWNYENEEKWLNEMSSKGLALVDYSWCRYVFEDAEPGEFSYRIELFDHPASHPDSLKKIEFFEETGIEFVASYMRWVYLRKKRSEGPFDLFSDTDSKIAHYKKVAAFWISFAAIEISIASWNLASGLTNPGYYTFSIVVGCLLFVFGAVFLGLSLPLLLKIRKLRQARRISEG